jgi:dTDP-4-dehydrorhamnose 3,5-epimerase
MRIAVTPLAIPDALLICPERVGDARGFFSEVFNKARLAEYGVDFSPVQENLAFNAEAGVVRGLHAQPPPYAQAKLVRAAKGSIVDVLVDARVGSSTFGRCVTVELSAETGDQVFIPAGCLHGYATREANSEVIYLVDAPYEPRGEICVRWDDAALGIDWGLKAGEAQLSAKDRAAHGWAAFQSPFRF